MESCHDIPLGFDQGPATQLGTGNGTVAAAAESFHD